MFAPMNTEIALNARAGFPDRGGGKKLIAARAALMRVLWSADGSRKIAAQPALDQALAKLPPDELYWLSELSPLGPIYLFPTTPFLRALAKQIRALGVTRVLEVAAGDGLLSRGLKKIAPDLQISASDSGAWEKPQGRMSAADKREHDIKTLGGLSLGVEVRKLEAVRAIRDGNPELVLASWIPPGKLLSKLIRSDVKYVLELGAGSGVTGDLLCWRFAHEFLEGPLENLARCRLDERPKHDLHSRATLYFGKAHEEFAEERLGKDHWLRAMS